MTDATQALPLYCADCNEVHMVRWLDVERIVYCLQGDLVDTEMDQRDAVPDASEPCLLEVLRWSWDGEMYDEYVTSRVGSREHFQPLDCPRHDFEPGPHHDPLCHYFDDDPKGQA